MQAWWKPELNIASKSELRERIRSIVARTPDIVGPDDMLFMIAVLRHHYEWVEKCGCGMSHLEVRSNGPTRGFWIVRIDGTAIDISWVIAIKTDGAPTQKESVTAAARQAVRSQVIAATSNGLCALCNTQIASNEKTHVDHINYFSVILKNWMAESGLLWDDVKTVNIDTYCVIEDLTLRNAWRDYHRKHAELRVVHARCNLTRERAA
jgi:hypothetical protein